MDDVIKVRTWGGGPLRQMSRTKVSAAFLPFAKTIDGCNFAGKYVCDHCLEPCSGLLLKDASDALKNDQETAFQWLCELCIAGRTRKTRTPEQKQALIARLTTSQAGKTSVNMKVAA
jgi:hypothetical protein